MIGLPCGEEAMTVCIAVSMEYRNLTDGQTDRHNCYINIARQCVLTRDKNATTSLPAEALRENRFKPQYSVCVTYKK